MQSPSPEGESSAREPGERAEQSFFTRERQLKRQGKSPIVSVADRPSLLNPFTQRLIRKWKKTSGKMHERHAATRTRMKEPLEFLTDAWRSFPRSLSSWRSLLSSVQRTQQHFLYPVTHFQGCELSLFIPIAGAQRSFFVQHVATVGGESLDRAMANDHRGTDCTFSSAQS